MRGFVLDNFPRNVETVKIMEENGLVLQKVCIVNNQENPDRYVLICCCLYCCRDIISVKEEYDRNHYNIVEISDPSASEDDVANTLLNQARDYLKRKQTYLTLIAQGTKI